jgi:hypothetical protein
MNELSCDNLRANGYLGLESAGNGVEALIRPLRSDLMPKPEPMGGLSPRRDTSNVLSSTCVISC